MQSVWRDARRWGVHAGALLLVLFLAMSMPASCSDIRAVSCIIGAPGETSECAIVIDQVSQGLSEFEVKVTLMDPGIGEITGVRFPSWAGLNSKSGVPSDSVRVKAVDTGKKVNPGDREVVLATLTVRGDAVGTCEVQVNVVGLKDEGGVLYSIPGRNGTLVVSGLPDPAGDFGPSANVQDPGIPAGDVPIPTLPTVDPGPGTPAVTFIMSPIPTPIPTPDPTQVPTPIQTQVEIPIPTPLATPSQAPARIETPTQVPTPFATPIPTPAVTWPADSGQENTDEREVDDGSGGEERSGSLCIDSDPAGALVLVEGRESGITPLCLDLEEGTYDIRISAADGYAWEGEITVAAGQTLTLPPFILKKPGHTILVEAGPHGSVYPSGNVEVIEGGRAEFFFTAERGYRLDGIQVDGVWQEPASPVRFDQVSSDHTLSGTFSPIPPPESDFSLNLTEGHLPLSVAFSDLSTGDITARLWHFGDGASSSEQSPVHVYTEAGTYTVSLDVCGEGGCALCRREGLITVRERIPPAANFSADNTCGPAPLTVQFQDLSTGSPDTWVWDFGDGNLSTDQSPVHVYTQPGTYNVLLAVSDDQYVSMAEKECFVNVSPGTIGGSVGYFLVLCPVDGAHVFLDGQRAGVIRDGTLTIPVYVTATPFRFIHVIAEGCLPYSGPVGDYPGENETVTIDIPLQSTRPGGGGQGRFQIPVYGENSTHTIPSLMG